MERINMMKNGMLLKKLLIQENQKELKQIKKFGVNS